MALVYTEIDNIIDNAPDVDVDVPFFDELKDNLEALASGTTSGVIETGANTFVGGGGKSIALAAAQADTNYRVIITPTENGFGNIGEIYVLKTTAGFSVVNSGSATTSFDWAVLR